MDPLSLLLGGGLNLLGGLFGSKERPTLDPRMLEQLFGPKALSNETNQLYRMLQASPAFSQIMREGALRGGQMGSQIRANLARRGVGSSPIAGFQAAASRGYGGAIQSRAQAGLFNEALQAALQNLSQRQNLYAQSFMSRQNMPTFGRQIGSSMIGAGGTMFADLLSNSGSKDSNIVDWLAGK